ncbi:GMC family oxidoreductase [Streptomyces stramineus]
MRPGRPAQPRPGHQRAPAGGRARRRDPRDRRPRGLLHPAAHRGRLGLPHGPQDRLDGRELYWPAGKVLGGGSSVNAMVYIRGNAADYDGWAARGLDGWAYRDVLPYFRRSEDNTRGADRYHGTGGPLAVSDVRDRHPLSEAFRAAALAAGLPANPDFNGAAQEGAGFYQATVRRGRRSGTARAFLRPAARRRNLTVRTRATVRRVLLERGRARGVSAELGGLATEFRARREVILAAGAIGSPKLLLLSGIGPAADLTALGIDVAAHSPHVGRNLQDHLTIGAGWRVRGMRTMESALRPANVLRYLGARRGPLASPVVEAGGFVPRAGGPRTCNCTPHPSCSTTTDSPRRPVPVSPSGYPC